MTFNGVKNREIVNARVLPGLKQFWSPNIIRITLKTDAERVIRDVAIRFGVSVKQVKSRSRKREVVDARHLAMYLIRKSSKMSLKSIGEFFGSRDHTTVLHSLQSVQDQMDVDCDYNGFVIQLQDELMIY